MIKDIFRGIMTKLRICTSSAFTLFALRWFNSIEYSLTVWTCKIKLMSFNTCKLVFNFYLLSEPTFQSLPAYMYLWHSYQYCLGHYLDIIWEDASLATTAIRDGCYWPIMPAKLSSSQPYKHASSKDWDSQCSWCLLSAYGNNNLRQ